MSSRHLIYIAVFLAVFALPLSVPPCCGQTLPATAPTSLTTPLAATPTGQPVATHPHKAAVAYGGGLLEVRANDSSLHQILRSIAHATGMTISGGVPDQRVFGQYGPDNPSTVLTTLLDGTGVNLLLRQGPNAQPIELVLTPRGGTPTSPIDMAAADVDADAVAPPVAAPTPSTISPPRQSPNQLTNPPIGAKTNVLVQPTAAQSVQVPPSLPQPLNNVNGSPSNTTPTAADLPTVKSVATDSLPTPASTQAVSGIVDSTNPPPAGSTTPPNANAPAAATPDSIYQQLLKLQQQKQQKAAPPATPQ